MNRPEYWARASRELARRDVVMATLVRRFRREALRTRGDPFATLARSIIGQQISVKAADSIWQRFTQLTGPVAPAAVLALAPHAIAACGLSRRKVEYLLDLAARFDSEDLRLDVWPLLSDEEVVRDLLRVRGIGRWTAEMFLIFNLLRPDIFPVDDIGLRRAVALLYRGGEMPSRAQLLQLGETWRPWRSVATWYLWRSLDPLPVDY